MQWGSSAYATGSSERTGCPRLPLFSTGAHKVVDWAIFSASICCGRGLWSLCGKSSALQVLWGVHLPLGLALVASAGSLIKWTSLPPSAPAWWHAETSWRMMDQWGPSISHLGHLSKNNLVLSPHSALLIDSPASLAHSLVDWDICSLSP